jgi:Tol biopolymer transport system component
MQTTTRNTATRSTVAGNNARHSARRLPLVAAATLAAATGAAFAPAASAGLYTMRADGSGKAKVTAGTRFDENPTWSPDGRTLAYHSCAKDFSACQVSTIKSRAPYGLPRVIARGMRNPTTGECAGAASDAGLFPDWHPNANRLALQHACRYNDKPSVVRARIVTGTGVLVRRIPGYLSMGRWSPDGTRLAWQDATYVDGASSILRTDAIGRHRIRLLSVAPEDMPNSAGLPVWSPDGRWVAYEKGYADAWVTDANGTSRRLLLAGARVADWR